MRAQHRAKSLARRRKKKSAAKHKQPSRWRTKAPADQIPNPAANPFALYRPGRLCRLFDIDKSTLTRWRKQGRLPPYVEINGVRGLTGQQIIDFYAQRRAAGEE